MHLVVIGVNHRTAPIDVREMLCIQPEGLREALMSLHAHPNVSECAILCTCNRSEFYAYTSVRADDSLIINWISEFCRTSDDAFTRHIYSHAGHKAAEHLFRVSSGLDSMVLGESQILGQVKAAYTSAVEAGTSGAVLNTLFQQAISVGKRVRTETGIGRGSFSIGSAAIQFARSVFDDLRGRTVLVIGAGKMGELAMAHLTSAGATDVLVANRTFDRAVALASRFSGRPVSFDNLDAALRAADIVISSTGAREPVLTRRRVAPIALSRGDRPMLLVDIAVPRDIEPTTGDLENVFLYDIDDLNSAILSSASVRARETKRVQEIIRQEVAEFMRWFKTLDAVPVIVSLREKLDSIRESELNRLRSRLPNLSDDDFAAIEAASRSIVNRICHEPMRRIKEYAVEDPRSVQLDTVCEIFGLPVDNHDTSSY